MFHEAITAFLLLTAILAYPTNDHRKHNATSLLWALCDLDFPSDIQELITSHGEDLFCANLTVPLDYTSLEHNRTLDLQLIKIKANKRPFKGSVLTNPGGPGGSGVNWIADEGPSIRDDLGGHHDVIGFDPR